MSQPLASTGFVLTLCAHLVIPNAYLQSFRTTGMQLFADDTSMALFGVTRAWASAIGYYSTRAGGVAAVAVFLIAMHPSTLPAAADSWTGASATTADWSDAANWSSGVPTRGDDLVFGQFNDRTTNLDDLGVGFRQQLIIEKLTFTPGAASFTIHITDSATLALRGAGIENNSGQTQTIVNDPLGRTRFDNSATAADLHVVNSVHPEGFDPGVTFFFDSSTAARATITNAGSVSRFTGGGDTIFEDMSSAGRANILNGGGAVKNSYGGGTFFEDESTVGNATITTNGGTARGAFGGVVAFRGSTASSATFIINGGAVAGAGGGVAFFEDGSAGQATIITNGGVSGAEGGATLFLSVPDGGTARAITNGNGSFDISNLFTDGMGIGSIEGSGNYYLGGKNLTTGRNNLSTTVSGVIQDGGGPQSFPCGTPGCEEGGSLIKAGTGTFTLSGANTYTGGTTVNAGALLINNAHGSGTGSGAVQVHAGTLGGTGTIAGGVTIGTGKGAGAVLSPGVTTGRLTVQSGLTMNSDATYHFEFNSSTGAANEVIANGIVINSAAISFSDLGSGTLDIGTIFTLINNTSVADIFGTFVNLADDSLFTVNGTTFRASYEGGTGNDFTATVTRRTAVPEQGGSSFVLLGSTLLLLGCWHRILKAA